MAKIGIIGDVHFSRYSSIVRSRGKKFSTRLEYLLNTLNWTEQIFKEHNCVEEIWLGDTFDKEELNSEEITALSEIDWNNSTRLRHFIVGNHESDVASLIYNSTQALNKVGVIEDVPYLYSFDDKTQFLFLPYINEDDRKSMSEYLKDRDTSKNLIVFSHNDIKNYQFGGFLSKTGFDIEDIESNCDLYINGHLHNGDWLTNKILNLGVVCGQNFSGNAFKYEHHIAILDTDTMKIELIENPYALNFYKIDISALEDLKQIDKIKSNAVIAFKCLSSLKNALTDKIKDNTKIVSYKTIYVNDSIDGSTVTTEEVMSKDYLEQFREYILETLGNSDVVQEELQEICK